MVITHAMATPDVPEDIPSTPSIPEDSVPHSSEIDLPPEAEALRNEVERQVEETGATAEDIERVRELLKDPAKNVGKILSQATSEAESVIDKVGEVFTPDKLLAGSIATVAGLKIGSAIVDGFIGLSSGVLGYVTEKLLQDVEKINYEIFYSELGKLDKALHDLDKVVDAASKAERLIEIKEQITPLYEQKISDSDVELFIEKVSCAPNLNAFEQAKIRSKLSGLIEQFKGPKYSMRKLCFQLAKMDELESKIDSIGRVLSIKFNDMRKYRLEKVRDEAEQQHEAWLERTEKNNDFIDKLRGEAISCLSSPENIKGTALEKVASHPKIVASLEGKPFDFSKVWNKYFSSHSTAFKGGFSRNMRQSDFIDRLNHGSQIWKMRCGSRRLRQCVSERAHSYSSTLHTDAQVYQALLKAQSKVNRGIELKGFERNFYDMMISELSPESKEMIKAPFGNMIMSSGPTSVEMQYTSLFGSSTPSEDINDLNSLSCDHKFIKPNHKSLCRVMLQGMQELRNGSCQKHFVDNNIKERGEELLEKEKSRRVKNIPLAVLKEENKLRRLEKFIEMINAPGSSDLEVTLRRLADKHDAYVQSGMCRAK